MQQLEAQNQVQQVVLDTYPELIRKAKEEKLKYVRVQDFEKAAAVRERERNLMASLEDAAKHFNLINIYTDAINI